MIKEPNDSGFNPVTEPRAVTNVFKKHGEGNISNPGLFDSPFHQIIRLVDDYTEFMRRYSRILNEAIDRSSYFQDGSVLNIDTWDDRVSEKPRRFLDGRFRVIDSIFGFCARRFGKIA